MRGDLARTNLPIPDRPHAGLVTYDAKDPDTAFPPLVPLLPPDGAPNVVLTSSSGGTVWTVTFSGTGVNGATHSIGDGEYRLVLSGVPGLTRYFAPTEMAAAMSPARVTVNVASSNG